MSAQELITEHLDLWTGAVTKKSNSGRGSNGKVELTGVKKLRELILELAVRGSLIDQVPGESAQELLERCLKAKVASVKQGKLKKTQKHAPIGFDDMPFSLPQGWAWSRLDDLLRVINGRAYKKHEMLSHGTPLLRVGNLFTSNDWYYSDLELEEDKYIDSGDLIYAWSASFGPFIWDGGRAIYHYHIWKLELFDEAAIDKQFLYLYLKAITEEIKSSGSGIAMIHMTKAKMEELVFPVPPLEEQHRIVQKVDELMALCDRLEQQTSDQLEAHETLVDTLLGTLTQSENATELADNWARLASHFDTLFTTEQSIDKLKQTILQLAVMGRLVEQSAEDTPVSKLLSSIENCKRELVENKKIKAPKKLPAITEDEAAFYIPQNWEWVKFGQLGMFVNGDRSKSYPNKEEYVKSGVAWINTGHIKPDGTLTRSDMHFITREKYDSLRGGKIEPTDLVYCLRGATFGKTAFVTPYVEGAIASSLMIVRPYLPAMRSYIYRYLTSPFGRSQIFRFDNGSAQPNLSANSVMLFAFPLPPIEEQHRIVQKVDELMALCDQLKERLNQAGETRCQLAEAVVEGALKT